MNKQPEISVVIPISERYDDVRALYNKYRDAVAATVHDYEFIYVLDGDYPDVYSDLITLRDEKEPVRIVRLARKFGEATAVMLGVEHSKADLLLFLPAYSQIEASALPDFIHSMTDQDMLVTRRWPRHDSLLNRVETNIFNKMLQFITLHKFHDLGCGVRLVRRRVFDEVTVYGDQHRFLPLLAAQRGFVVGERDIPQSRDDARYRIYRPMVYLRRVLDLFALFFLVRFTKKPLRFFGVVASVLISIGLAILLTVSIQRLLFEVALADRPALLLGVVFLVLGVQLFALGLIGELIIFTHAREIKEYAVAETINMGSTSTQNQSGGGTGYSADGHSENSDDAGADLADRSHLRANHS